MFQRLFLFLFILLSFSACSDNKKQENEYTENLSEKDIAVFGNPFSLIKVPL